MTTCTPVRQSAIHCLRCLAVLLFLAAVTALQAQVPFDFARGFDLLVQAGLPDTKGWEYVAVEGATLGVESDSLARHTDDDVSPVEGNGWKQKVPGPDGLERFVAGGPQTGVMVNRDEQGDGEAAIANHQKLIAAGLAQVTGEVKLVDEQKDAQALVKWLAEVLAGAERKEQLLNDGSALKHLFYRAAHWHRRGFVKEGEQIVRTLLEAVPRRESLLELVMEDLASAQAWAAMRRFGGSLDWNALERDLSKLLADFPIGWRQRPLAERLLAQVKPRAAGEPLKPFAGEFPLTAEQQAWWDKLVEFKPPPNGVSDPNSVADMWLHLLLNGEDTASSLLSRDPWRQEKGWDWIAVMAAALGDETPVPMGLEPQFLRHSYDPFSPSEPMPELQGADLEQAWQQWNRPKTRGEIAEQFLATVVPTDDEDYRSRASPPAQRAARLRKAVKEWNEIRAGKTELELARLYVERGNDRQKQTAAQALISKGTEADLSLMEELLLASPQQSMQLAEALLRRRKAAGKDFMEKYKAAVMTELKEMFGRGGKSDENVEASIPDYLKQQIEALENLASGRGVPEILEDFVSGKLNEQALATNLRAGTHHFLDWSDEDSKSMLATIGRLPAKQGRRKLALMEMYAHVSATKHRQSGRDGAEPSAAPPPSWVLDGFRPLIGEDGDALVEVRDGTIIPLRSYAALVLDQVWDIRAHQELMEILRPLPESDYWPVIEARARARLDGQPLPAVPSAADVPESRRIELVARLRGPGPDWNDFVESLTVEEKLLVAGELREVQITPEWRAQILKISEFVANGAAAAKHDARQSLVDQPVTARSIQAIVSVCQQAALAGAQDLRGWLRAQPLHTGMSLRIYEDSPDFMGAFDIPRWLKQSRRQADSDPPFTAVAAFYWMEKHQMRAVLWQLGVDGEWSQVNPQDLPDAWSANLPIRLMPSPEELDELFDKWAQSWNPNTDVWQVEFGVWRVPPKEAP